MGDGGEWGMEVCEDMEMYVWRSMCVYSSSSTQQLRQRLT